MPPDSPIVLKNKVRVGTFIPYIAQHLCVTVLDPPSVRVCGEERKFF